MAEGEATAFRADLERAHEVLAVQGGYVAGRVGRNVDDPEPSTSGLQVDQPTDDVKRPPEGVRNHTLTFEGTSSERWAAGLAATPDPAWSAVPARPGPVVGPRPRPVPEKGRRWPWVVLTLVPLLVIVGAGIWLLLLLRAA